MTLVIVSTLLSSFATVNVSGQTPMTQTLESNKKSSYKVIKVATGYEKLVYYAKKFNEPDKELQALKNKLPYLSQTSKQYRQNLTRQNVLIARKITWLKKIQSLLENGEITPAQHFKVMGY